MNHQVNKTKEPFIAGHLYRARAGHYVPVGTVVLCTEPIFAGKQHRNVTSIAHRCLVCIDDGRLVATTPTRSIYEDVTEELLND